MTGILKKPKFIKFFLILLCSLFFYSFSVQAIGVRPLVIDLEVSPGATEEFEITLTPSDEVEIVNLSFYRPIQVNTGALLYQEADRESYPVLNWIQLEENRVEMGPGENKVIRGRVTAPFAAEGTHTVVIMVEPEVEETERGVTFKIRYAVRVNIKIDRPGLRPRGELLSLEFLKEDVEYPQINVLFRNISKLYYETSAEATLRNEQGRLIQRIELKPPAAWQSGSSSTTIYPGAEVFFTGGITEPLYPGDYQLRVFFRYANGMQLIEKREIRVEEGIGIDQHFKALRIQPENISLELRPGAASSQLIEIENLSNEEVHLFVSGRDIEPDYPHSIYGKIEIQMRGEQEMLLPPYGKKRLVTTFRAPGDLAAGAYYGYLDFVQPVAEDRAELYSVDLEVISGRDELAAEAEILSLYPAEEIFSVEILNKGKGPLYPEGRLFLKDGEGRIVKEIGLSLQEGMEKILPGKSGLMLGIEEDIPAGSYTAEVNIYEAGQSIVKKEYVMEVN